MSLRQTLLQSVGGTLDYCPQETGTISSAHVDLFDSTGAQRVFADTNVTITQASGDTPAKLAYAVPGDSVLVSVLGENLRVLWAYVAGGKTYRRNNTFDVTVAQIYPTLTTPDQLAFRYPILQGRDFLGTANQQALIAKAWEDLLNRIRGYGKNPNRFIDPSSLEPAHAALAASYVARSYRPGSAKSVDWQQWSDARAQEASRSLREVLSNFPWYDQNQDLIPGVDEEHVGLHTVRFSR